MARQPTDIPGLALWLKAEDIASTNNAAIVNWAPSIGGSAFSASTTSRRPTYITAGLNGLPVVRFDGTSDALTATTLPLIDLVRNLSGITMMAVLKTSSTATGGRNAIFFGGADPTYSRIQMGTSGSSSRVIARRVDTDSGAALTYTGVTTTAAHVLTGVADYSTGKAWLYRNGTAGASSLSLTSTGTTPDVSSNTLTIGAGGTGTYEFWAGDIAEVLLWPRVLTAQERAQAHSYLSDRYAITVSDYVADVGTPVALSVALSGSGSVTAASSASVSQSAATSGTGTLAAATSMSVPLDVTVSGSGDLSIATAARYALALALSGEGFLDAQMSGVQHTLSVALSGSGSMAVDLSATMALTVDLSSEGTTRYSPAAIKTLDFDSRSAGTLDVGLQATPSLTVNLSGSGGLAVTMPGVGTADASLSSEGALTVALAVTKTAAADPSGSGSVAVDLSVTRVMGGALSGSGSLTVGLSPVRPLAVTLSGTGTLTGSASTLGGLTVGLEGDGALVVDLVPVRGVRVNLSGEGTPRGDVSVTVDRTLSLAGTGGLGVTLTVAATLPLPLGSEGTLAVSLRDATNDRDVTLWGQPLAQAWHAEDIDSTWSAALLDRAWLTTTPEDLEETMRQGISTQSYEYVGLRVTGDHDLSTDTVEVTVLPRGTWPSDTTVWYATDLLRRPDPGSVDAFLLVGPGSKPGVLAPGLWMVWARVQDNPERIVVSGEPFLVR